MTIEQAAGAYRPGHFVVCEKLGTSLTRFAGMAGFRSLLSRARSLAVADVDWLERVTVEADGSLVGTEVISGLSADDIVRGEIILVAHLVSLLITFIGETLTLRLLQDAWPEVSRGDINPESESEQ